MLNGAKNRKIRNERKTNLKLHKTVHVVVVNFVSNGNKIPMMMETMYIIKTLRSAFCLSSRFENAKLKNMLNGARILPAITILPAMIKIVE